MKDDSNCAELSQPVGHGKRSYRLLIDLEVVRGGDEHLCDDCETWDLVPKWNVGRTYFSGVFMPIRRAV